MAGVKNCKNPSNSEKNKTHLEPEENAFYIDNAMWAAELPKIDLHDPDAVWRRMKLYFDHCKENGVKPGVEGMCNALGTTRGIFFSWIKGNYNKSNQQVATKAKQILADMMEQYMQNGDVNPVVGIFLMSNNYGYVQRTIVSTEPAPTQLDTATPEELEKRYNIDIIDAEVEPSKKRLSHSSSDDKTESEG